MYKYGDLQIEFEWDYLKEAENIKTHKISFSNSIEAFSDPNGFSMFDIKHSKTEKRFYWIGKISSEQVLTIRYTIRGNRIRIFGAAMWRDFRELYYEKTKKK